MDPVANRTRIDQPAGNHGCRRMPAVELKINGHGPDAHVAVTVTGIADQDFVVTLANDAIGWRFMPFDDVRESVSDPVGCQ